MPRTNITNTTTGKAGYQVPGAAIPEGWSSDPAATSPAREAYTSNLASNPLVERYNQGGGQDLTTSQIGEAMGSKPDYLSSYRNYLKQYTDSLKENPDVTAARTQLGDIQTAGDERSLSARKAYEDLIHKSGGTKGGALEAGSVSNRNNSYILANLGVAESGAARKLDALTGSQIAQQNYLKSLIDMSRPIQVGNQYIDPTTGQAIDQGAKERTGIIGEYEYAVANGYKGSFSDYQNEDANRKRSVTATPKLTTAEIKANAYSTINRFLQPGAMVGPTPVLSPEGYLTWDGFKRLLNAAKEDGITRKEFIAEYSSYINPSDNTIEKYGLTAAELKAIRGY